MSSKTAGQNSSLVLGEVFERFIKGSPVTVMARAAMENALRPEELERLFEATATSQYTRELLFSSLVNLMSLVVFKIRRTVNAAHQAMKDDVQVSVAAVYEKLQRLEPAIGAALVGHSSERLGQVIEAMGGELDPLLPGYRLRILDGNHLASTQRRLKVLRGSKAGPLPGHALVVFDPSLMMVTDVIPCEDGHAQERSLTPAILALVQPRDVWLDDRNFCTTPLLFGITEREGLFITRQHAGLSWCEAGPSKQRRRIADDARVSEQEVLIWEGDRVGRTQHVRRITVHLSTPTRDGEREIHILTNLPEEVPAEQIAMLYRKRWTLETAFQELEKTLAGEIETLGYPKAALFAFCIALAAYNVLSTVKAALRAAHGHKRVQEEVSSYYIAEEVQCAYHGMMLALPKEEWAPFQQMTPGQLGVELVRIAGHARLAQFLRHPRGPKKPVPKRTRYLKHTHVSTARLLAAAARKKSP